MSKYEYLSKEEIDYSLDYGEYTFDSKNFADYDDKDAATASRDAQANDGRALLTSVIRLPWPLKVLGLQA